jgi:hypothetical protein
MHRIAHDEGRAPQVRAMDGGSSASYNSLRDGEPKGVHRRNASFSTEFGSDTQLVLLDVPSPTGVNPASPLLVRRFPNPSRQRCVWCREHTHEHGWVCVVGVQAQRGFSTPVNSPQKPSPLIDASPTPSFRAVRTPPHHHPFATLPCNPRPLTASPPPSHAQVRYTASELPPRDVWEHVPPSDEARVGCCCLPLPAACCARCGTVHTGRVTWVTLRALAG